MTVQLKFDIVAEDHILTVREVAKPVQIAV